MKHFILTTLVTFFISTVSFSQSNLVVYSNDGVNFTLEVNGVQQNETPTTNVKVEGIAQEFISVRILFADGKTPALKKSFPLTKKNEVLDFVKDRFNFLQGAIGGWVQPEYETKSFENVIWL